MAGLVTTFLHEETARWREPACAAGDERRWGVDRLSRRVDAAAGDDLGRHRPARGDDRHGTRHEAPLHSPRRRRVGAADPLERHRVRPGGRAARGDAARHQRLPRQPQAAGRRHQDQGSGRPGQDRLGPGRRLGSDGDAGQGEARRGQEFGVRRRRRPDRRDAAAFRALRRRADDRIVVGDGPRGLGGRQPRVRQGRRRTEAQAVRRVADPPPPAGASPPPPGPSSRPRPAVWRCTPSSAPSSSISPPRRSRRTPARRSSRPTRSRPSRASRSPSSVWR